MVRIIVTAVSALVMLYLGIQALAFRSDSISSVALTGPNQEAFNTTNAVVTDATQIAGNALPRLFIIVLLVLVVGALVLTR